MPRIILARTLETLADGAVWGIAIAAVGGAALALWRRRPPIAGYLVAVGFLIVTIDRVDDLALVGFVLLVIPALLLRRSDPLFHVVTAIPGAALVGFGVAEGWRAGLATVAIVVGGALAADFAKAHDERGLPAIFLTIATMGAWLEIPDVDRILVLLGVALPLLFLSWPRVLVTTGASAYVWVALLIWVAVDGGSTRPASVVGTAATLGLLLVEPVVRRVTGFGEGMFLQLWNSMDPPFDIAVPIVAQGGVAFAVSRLAGIQDSTLVAFVIAVAILTATGAGLVASSRTADLY